MIDHSLMPLGRKAIKRGSRTLPLSRYLSPAVLPPPPGAVNWSRGVSSWTPLLNDQLGDCTIAAALHLDQAWSANAGRPFTPTDAQALSAYESIDGYVPGNPSTDNGGVELDVLAAWKNKGIGGRRILGFASIDLSNREEVLQAISLFGGIYIGVTLPISAQTQAVWWNAGSKDGGIWGGHAIPILDYDSETLACVTWGEMKEMTWSFFRRYCDEAYAVLSSDFIETQGAAPSGFNLAQLKSDLALVH